MSLPLLRLAPCVLVLASTAVACGASQIAPESPPAPAPVTVARPADSVPAKPAEPSPPPEPTRQPLSPLPVAPPPPGDPERQSQPSAAGDVELEGTIAGRKGATVTLDAKGPVRVGQTGVLLRFADMVLLSGWLEIADVTVTQVKGDKITLKIELEKSKIEINGKHVNHYVPGTKAMLRVSPTK